MACLGRPGCRGWAGASLVLVVVLALAACTESVAGRAMRATDRSSGLPTSAKPARARDLLLQDGDRAPFGQVTQSRVGDSYFTSAVPPECSAALLFKGSPLRPDGSSDHAEAAYNVTGPLPYAESVDVYTNVLNVHDVVPRRVPLPWRCRRSEPGRQIDAHATQVLRYAVRRCPGMDHEQSALDV